MLRSVNNLVNCGIEATDGKIGKVSEFYFDDEKWTVRYLVVDTGGWLTDRKVLISPAALGDVDWNSRKLHVEMTRERVQNSPDIDTDKPVSRQHEKQYDDYYGYPYYWGGPSLWGPVAFPIYPPPYRENASSSIQGEIAAAERQQDDVHLRSTREVTDYHIDASDGEIGHVEDFLIDDESWTIRYIVVDTRNWWPGKKVLISPEWIEDLNWTDSTAHVDLSRDVIKNSPEYDESAINRDYEKRLHEHYGRSEYWDH